MSRPLSQAGPVGRLFAGLLVGALGLLPRRALLALGRGVGALVYALGIRRRVTLDNLRHAYPELPEPERRRIARGAYRNMACAALESLTATRLAPAALDALVELENWDLMERARAEGKGVLVATGHFGSWELLGAVMGRRGLPVHAVVKPLKGAINERIVRSRLESGLKLIAARGSVSGSLAALAEGGIVAMLVDQVLNSPRGVFVPFFGREASTSPGLSLVAKRSGAPVLVAMAAREGDRLRLVVEGPFPLPDTGDEAADLRAHTATITAALERIIRRYPDQWLWLHRRWKAPPVRTPSAAPAPSRSAAGGS